MVEDGCSGMERQPLIRQVANLQPSYIHKSATQRHVSLEISMRFEVNHWFVTTYPSLGGRLSLSDLLLRPWPLAGAMSDTGNIVRGNTNR